MHGGRGELGLSWWPTSSSKTSLVSTISKSLRLAALGRRRGNPGRRNGEVVPTPTTNPKTPARASSDRARAHEQNKRHTCTSKLTFISSVIIVERNMSCHNIISSLNTNIVLISLSLSHSYNWVSPEERVLKWRLSVPVEMIYSVWSSYRSDRAVLSAGKHMFTPAVIPSPVQSGPPGTRPTETHFTHTRVNSFGTQTLHVMSWRRT